MVWLDPAPLYRLRTHYSVTNFQCFSGIGPGFGSDRPGALDLALPALVSVALRACADPASRRNPPSHLFPSAEPGLGRHRPSFAWCTIPRPTQAHPPRSGLGDRVGLWRKGCILGGSRSYPQLCRMGEIPVIWRLGVFPSILDVNRPRKPVGYFARNILGTP